MRKKTAISIVFFAMSLMLIVACDNKAAQSEKKMQFKTLASVQEFVRGNSIEVASLDPHKVVGVPESNILRDLMEGLVIEDSEGNIIAGTAESWEIINNKRFVFTLRQNAKWSNGDAVTAMDFEYAYKRAVDPLTASPYAWYLEKAKIKNADQIIKGKKPASTLGVKALDAKTLMIETQIAIPYFIKMLAHTTMYPLHQATLESHGREWTKPEHFVSNGAFRLNNWIVNEKIELVRNDHYWNNAETVLNKVTYLPIENPTVEMNRFLSGDIDMTSVVPNEHFARLKKEHSDELIVTPLLCTYYYGFNNKKPPFDDVRVRQALSYLIDRDIITKALLGQGQLPAYSLTHSKVADFTPTKPHYALLSQRQRNQKAKKLLAQSGIDKQNPLNFTLLYNTSENHKKIALAIYSMWKKALGERINVQLDNQEWKSYLDNRRQGNFDVTRAAWCADYNEASAFLAIGVTDNANNHQGYSSEIFDKAIKDAENAKTAAHRNLFYAKAEAALSKDMPIAPIYQYVQTRLLSTKVSGFPHKNHMDNVYSKDLSIRE